MHSLNFEHKTLRFRSELFGNQVFGVSLQMASTLLLSIKFPGHYKQMENLGECPLARPVYRKNQPHFTGSCSYVAIISYLQPVEGNFVLRMNFWLKIKQTPWPLVRKRTIPTERPPFVDEI
jgi:hypothetical protein